MLTACHAFNYCRNRYGTNLNHRRSLKFPTPCNLLFLFHFSHYLRACARAKKSISTWRISCEIWNNPIKFHRPAICAVSLRSEFVPYLFYTGSSHRNSFLLHFTNFTHFTFFPYTPVMSGFHGMLKYQIEEFVILHSKIKSFQHLAAIPCPLCPASMVQLEALSVDKREMRGIVASWFFHLKFQGICGHGSYVPLKGAKCMQILPI